VVVTTPNEPRRAMAAGDLAALCGRPVTVVPSIPEAVQTTLDLAGTADLVVVTGSTYTVGPARTALRNTK
jgi:dihydrofolate synthase / folylpolyglutamate synthase